MGKRASPPRRTHETRPAAGPRRVTPERLATASLVALTLAAFLPACGNGFVEYDDQMYVYENPHVLAGLSAEAFWWALTATYAGNWHPLTWWSLQLDSELYGLDPAGFHLTNVLFHAAAVVLLFWVLRLSTGSVGPSAAAAAVFAVHPLRVESVAWVAERKDVLSAFLWMLTLLAYVRYARTPGVGRYAAVVGAFALGLMAKPMLVTLPCVLLLLDHWPLGRLRRGSALRLVAEKLPLIALAAAASAVTVHAQGQAVQKLEMFSLDIRVGNAFLSATRYLGLLLWPSGLAAFYPHPRLGVMSGAALGSAGLLVAVTAVAAWQSRRRPYLAVGWLWFLGTLLPVVGLVQVGSQGSADRYTYIPLVGVTVAAVWALAEVAGRSSGLRAGLLVAGGAALALMLLGTWSQTAHWRDTESLWNRALAVTAGNHEAHRNLGAIREREGKFDEARKHFEAALACHPDKRVVHNDLGALFIKLRRYDEAERHFRASRELDPGHAETRNNLGSLYLTLGRPVEAVLELEEARELNPAFAGTHYNLAVARAMQGLFVEAAAHFADGERLDPGNAVAHHHFGAALRNRNRHDLAVPQFEAAVALRPANAEYHSDLGLALRFSRQLPRAVQAFREAVSLNPRESRYHRYLAHALNESGDLAGAVRHYRDSLDLDRRWPDAVDQQAWRLAGHPDAAVRNGPAAVHLAEQVCQATGFRDAGYVDTLAAAYAEAGRFDEAVTLGRKAVGLAVAAREDSLAAEMRDRVKLYEAKKAFRGRVASGPK